MKFTNAQFPDLEIDDDPTRLDRRQVWDWLTKSDWCLGIPQAMVDRAMKGSLCFGLYCDDRQLAFARIVSDRATFAWLCDVVVDEPERGRGLGTWLIQVIRQHPELQELRRFLLATRDGHDFYRSLGFETTVTPDRYMEVLDSDVYQRDTSRTS